MKNEKNKPNKNEFPDCKFDEDELRKSIEKCMRDELERAKKEIERLKKEYVEIGDNNE